MADKVRKIPAAFQGKRAIPAQYTTDPDIATPEQIASIGTANAKAKNIAKGNNAISPASTASPIRTNLTGGQANLPQAKGTPISTTPAGLTATSKASVDAGAAFAAGLKGAAGSENEGLFSKPNQNPLPTDAAPKKSRVVDALNRLRAASEYFNGSNVSGGAGRPARQTPNRTATRGSISTSPSKVNVSGGPGAPATQAPNSPLTRARIKELLNTPRAESTGGQIATAPEAINATSKAPVVRTIKPNFEKLALGEQASIKMSETSLSGQGIDPTQDESHLLLQEILARKQLVEPEQNRLRSLFRRMDNLYHPETITLGGADHWADDPSARLAGRAHVSVNIHHAYVQIPASIQAVRPVVNYVATGPTPEERNAAQLRERLYFRWWDANEMDLLHEHAALLKELYGHTAAKVYWDPVAELPKISVIERPENLYLGFGDSDFNRLDWALYCYGMSPQSVQEDYGVEVIPVKQGDKYFPYTTRGTHDDPIGNVWSNTFERNPLRRETAYEQMQVEVYDYWYKVPTKPGKAPLVYNAIFVGNSLVKNDAHPEYQGQIPYVHLPNGKIPGSPYGKPALYDAEQLLREKDERVTAMAQMIQSIVGGQMWQLVGPEAPDEVPPNALPKPGRVATPGPGNELRAIQPFIPSFQIEQYIGRIDRELAVATGLNDLLLGLAPAQVLGSSRAIAALIANYEARLAPKRKVFYQWMRQVWEMCARIWEIKNPAVAEIIGGQYRIDIVAPELTPRDTLELASTAINLVQNRLWSAERAMDRVGVEDPIGEKDLIRDEQTDATLNPAAVATMSQVMQQMAMMQQQQAMMSQEQAANAQRTLQQGVPGSQSLNQPENQAQLPPEAMPENAAAPGEENLVPAPTGTNEVPA